MSMTLIRGTGFWVYMAAATVGLVGAGTVGSVGLVAAATAFWIAVPAVRFVRWTETWDDAYVAVPTPGDPHRGHLTVPLNASWTRCSCGKLRRTS